jgi:hypothetical protein
MAGSTELIYAIGSLRWLASNAKPEAERLHWAARLRDLHWVMQASAGSDALGLQTLPLIWEEGEIPVLMAHLEERGQWPPPPDWQPPVTD